jgi:hypothetical protein
VAKMSAVAPLGNILSGATRNALQSLSKLQGPAQTLPKSNILDDITKFFTNIGKAPPKVAIPTSVKTGAGSISKNVAFTGGTILGTTAISSIFLSTPQGQNTLETANNALNFGGQINSLFRENPLVPLGLLVLGGLVVVSVIKK